jgi:parallel beta-helix repeat protein
MIAPVFRRLLAAFAGQPSTSPNRRRSVGLTLEVLEVRAVPATLHVGAHEQFTTIQSAVNFASPGDKVQVDSGTYQEQVTINTSITLKGQGNSTFILAPTSLSAPTAGNPGAIVRITGNGTFAEIEHFVIEGAPGGTANLLYGVRVDGHARAEIENDTIANTIDSSDPSLGVAIDVGNTNALPDGAGAQVGTAEIDNNTISNYQRAGIVVSNGASAADIENNKITASATFQADSQTGVEVSDGAVADIENNTITGNNNGSNGTGILLFSPGMQRLPDFDSDRNDFFIATVKNNKISGNDYGIFGSEVTVAASLHDQPASADVENNQITSNTFVGIEFDNSSNVSISNNKLSGNGSGNTADGGIYLFHSTNNTLTKNQSENNNGSGIYIDAFSTGNYLKNNQFKKNVFSIAAGNADAVDLSTGNGTSGTANTWCNNQGQTFITVSGKSVLKA